MLSSYLDLTRTPLLLHLPGARDVRTTLTPSHRKAVLKRAAHVLPYTSPPISFVTFTEVVRSNSKTLNIGITFVTTTTFWTSALLEYL